VTDIASVYVRQPLEVEAVRVSLDRVKELVEWCGAIHSVTWVGKEVILFIKSNHQGTLMVTIGDWLVREPDGFYKIYKDTEFKAAHIGKRFFGDDIPWPNYDH
jgi:hypothetical protein